MADAQGAEDLRRLIQRLEQLTGRQYKLKVDYGDPDAVAQALDDVDSKIKKATGSVRGLGGAFGDLNSQLKENLAELSKSNNALNDGKKAYRSIVGEVRKLADEEDGIYRLTQKQLEISSSRTQSSLKELKIAGQRLSSKYGLLNASKQEALENIKNLESTGEIKEEEAAILRAKVSNYEQEEKAARFTEYRLKLEKSVNKSLSLTGNLLNGIQSTASKLGMKGFATDLQNISDKLGDSIRKKIRSRAEDSLAFANKEYRVAKQYIGYYEKRLASGEELSDEETKLYETHQATIVGLEEEVQLRQKSLGIIGRFREALKTLPGIALSFAKNLIDPVFLLGALVKNFGEVDKAGVSFQRLTGQNAKALAGMNSSLVSSTEVLQTMSEVSNRLNMNINGILSLDEVGQLSESVKLLGLGNEQAALLATYSEISGESIQGFKESVVDSTNRFNKLNKRSINHGQVMQDVLSTSEDIALSLGGDAGRIASAAAAARKLGLDLKRVDQIAGSLMDFESSINNELEAQLLTGGQINLGKARELALNNDLEGLSKEIANNNALSQGFGKANRIQQESMAKALGMSREELAKMIALEKLGEKISKEEVARASGMTVAQIEQLSLQEKINTLLSKLGQAAAPLLEVLVPVVDLIGAIVKPLANSLAFVGQLGVKFREFVQENQGFKDTVSSIEEKMAGVVGFFKDMTGGLSNFLAQDNVKGFLSILGNVGKIGIAGGVLYGLGRKLMKGKLGTKNNPMIVQFNDKLRGIKDLLGFGKKGGIMGKFNPLEKLFGKKFKGGQMMPGGGRAAAGGQRMGGLFQKSIRGGMNAKGMVGEAAGKKSKGLFGKLGGKGLAKVAGKGVGKSLLKKLPFGLGLLAGGAFALPKLLSGDFTGAGLELASGAASTIPGLGTLASTGIDAAIMARDAKLMGSDEPTAMATGGIVTQPINAIVGEAGSEAVIPLREFYAKMDELINVVRQGGDVYMDGNKVGESLMLASTKLS